MDRHRIASWCLKKFLLLLVNAPHFCSLLLLPSPWPLPFAFVALPPTAYLCSWQYSAKVSHAVSSIGIRWPPISSLPIWYHGLGDGYSRAWVRPASSLTTTSCTTGPTPRLAGIDTLSRNPLSGVSPDFLLASSTSPHQPTGFPPQY